MSEDKFIQIGLITIIAIMIIYLLFFTTQKEEKIYQIDLSSCFDGCLYAEKIIFKEEKLNRPSEIYSNCSVMCWKEYCKEIESKLCN